MVLKKYQHLILVISITIAFFYNIPRADADITCSDCKTAVEQWQVTIPENPILADLDLSADLEKETVILVDTVKRVLTVLVDGKPEHKFPVAVGKYETPTPIGEFKVLRRARNWGTGFGSRWIGLTVPWGIYGIHGTNKPYAIGSYASHGCIRMHNKHVEQVYPMVKPGTRVIIIGPAFKYQEDDFRTMRRDDRGGDVVEIQRRLKRLGYYYGPIDGIWGGGMERAIMAFRKSRELHQDNCVDDEFYRLLGL